MLNVHPRPVNPNCSLRPLRISPLRKTMRSWACSPVSIHRARSSFWLETLPSARRLQWSIVCREDSVKELLQRLNVSKASDLKPFEALLHVKIAHGVPVVTDLVAVRNRSN